MCFSDHSEDHLIYKIDFPGVFELYINFRTRQTFRLVEPRREGTMRSSMHSEIRHVHGSTSHTTRVARCRFVLGFAPKSQQHVTFNGIR